MPNHPWRWSCALALWLQLMSGCSTASNDGGHHPQVLAVPPLTHPVAAVAAAASKGSGLIGQAIDDVGCGVRPSGSRGCAGPHHPHQATIRILRLPSKRQIALIHTGRDGRFRITLPPGIYELIARSPIDALHTPPVALRLHQHQFERLLIRFVSDRPPPR